MWESLICIVQGYVHLEYLQIRSWGWKRELGFITQQIKPIEGVYEIKFLGSINFDIKT